MYFKGFHVGCDLPRLLVTYGTAALFPQASALSPPLSCRLPPLTLILLACGWSQDVTVSADARPPPRYRLAGHLV